jgi:hypothetical protein
MRGHHASFASHSHAHTLERASSLVLCSCSGGREPRTLVGCHVEQREAKAVKGVPCKAKKLADVNEALPVAGQIAWTFTTAGADL